MVGSVYNPSSGQIEIKDMQIPIVHWRGFLLNNGWKGLSRFPGFVDSLPCGKEWRGWAGREEEVRELWLGCKIKFKKNKN